MGGSRSVWAIVLTAVAVFIVTLDAFVVATALTTIQVDLGATIEELEWTVNAYNLTFAVLQMPAAALGERLGRRRTFAIGIGIFTAASAACALSPSAEALILARALQGVGSAIVMPLSLTLLSNAFPPEKRGSALGLWGGIAGIATASGPVVGGVVVEGIDWQWIFWINIPIGVVALPLVFLLLRESHGPRAPFDFTGVGLITTGALGIVWGLQRGNVVGWDSVEVLGTMVGGAALLVAFIVCERRIRHPLIPLALFRRRAFAAGNGAVFWAYAAMFGAIFLIAQYLQIALGYSPLETGLRMLPWTVPPIVITPIAGMLADRLPPRPILMAGLLLQGIGLAWLGLQAEPGLAYGAMVIPLIVAGTGIAITIPVAMRSALTAVDPAFLGKASGVQATVRILGGVFGVAVIVALFAAEGGLDSPQLFVDGFTPAMVLAGALSALGAVVAVASPGRQRAPADAAVRAPSRA